MRMDQRMSLAPRMIQSMEVLQLPLLALQEKIEAELNSNPVLEQVEDIDRSESRSEEDISPEESDEKELVVNDDNNNVEDFERLDNIGGSFDDYMERASEFKRQMVKRSSEPDKKMEALQNTAAQEHSLHEHLVDQWRLVEVDEPVMKAGESIIDYIDDKGYLTVQLEQLYNKDIDDYDMNHLREALDMVQKLDPAGTGARDLRECLLIQMAQSGEDMSFEEELVSDHMDELLANHLPQIARKMNCSIDRINEAVSKLSKLDTSPGLLVGRDENHPITADVIVEFDSDSGDYTVSLADTSIPNLRVNNFYSRMAKNRSIDDKTRDFLSKNIQSAKWLMDAIVQRKQTLLNVAGAVVSHQKEFFDKGKLYLKPLPMQTIADEVGVHIATVSRAVSGKYVQCPQGILPLRGFFSGGTDDSNGESQSWEAVRAQLQQIVDNEDKSKPLNDDEIRHKLFEMGVNNIARRTVAKYRKLLNIPAARYRKKY